MSNPSAFFDTLSLAAKLTDLVDGFSRPELHLFSYASCLLSIYEGQPAADWGYEFVSTANGLPFSTEVDEAIEEAVSLHQLAPEGSLFSITTEGTAELSVLREWETNQARERFLVGAADALLVLNPGNVREAFNYDPTISFLKDGERADWLLKKPVEERLYANFQQVRQVLACESQDLSVPLVTWLKYLLQEGRSAELA